MRNVHLLHPSVNPAIFAMIADRIVAMPSAPVTDAMAIVAMDAQASGRDIGATLNINVAPGINVASVVNAGQSVPATNGDRTSKDVATIDVIRATRPVRAINLGLVRVEMIAAGAIGVILEGNMTGLIVAMTSRDRVLRVDPGNIGRIPATNDVSVAKARTRGLSTGRDRRRRRRGKDRGSMDRAIFSASVVPDQGQVLMEVKVNRNSNLAVSRDRKAVDARMATEENSDPVQDRQWVGIVRNWRRETLSLRGLQGPGQRSRAVTGIVQGRAHQTKGPLVDLVTAIGNGMDLALAMASARQ